MELVDLVSDLLYRHNCVIIPGIGGFVANYSQAELKEDNRSIIPARKRIAFNQSLLENDGLLVSNLSKNKRISYAEAEAEVLSFTKFVKERVVSHKSFEFKNVGTFYLNKDENLVFVPYEGLNMLPASYGLMPVKIRPVNRTQTSISLQEKSNNEKNEEPVLAIDRPNNNEKPGFLKRILPWVSSAAVVLVLGLSYQFLSKTEFPEWQIKKQQTEQDASLLDFDSQTLTIDTKPALEKEKVSNAPVEVIKETEPTKEIENNTNKHSEIKEVPAKTDPDWLLKWQALQHQITYHLVVKTSSNQDALLSAKSELENKGYSAEIITKSDQFHLSIEHFTVEKNAREYLTLLKRSYKTAKIIETNQ